MDDQIKKLVSAGSWFISLQAVTLVVLLGGAGILYADFQSLRRQIENVARGIPEEVANWEEYIRPHNVIIGNASAPVVIDEYTDFQCPFCRSFNENLRAELLKTYGDQIRLVFKNYPLEAIHPQAEMAAIAAQCAHRDGKFLELKDVQFAHPDELSREFLVDQGMLLGLGMEYEQCVLNEETLAEVEQDMSDGAKAGIQGTPTFVINGKVLAGASSLSKFRTIIDELN